MPDNPLRIVSLVPSATETVFRLGAGGALVGRSHVCDFPPEARTLPVLTKPELASTTSRGIHDEVRERLAGGLSIYDIDLEQLRALEPTHLLVQDQCSVCAISPADVELAAGDWFGEAPALVRLAPHQLVDVWSDLESIGAAIGRGAEARALRESLSERLSEIVERVAKQATRPRVACVEWLDPIMIAGHWAPELVRIAGGEPILAKTGGPSATIEVETLISAQPDVIFLQLCGFDLETSRVAWRSERGLRSRLHEACPNARFFVADGDAYFNRPGPRLLESAEILAEALHPERVPMRHRDAVFTPLDVD